jgi:hypothetical protein
MPRSKVQTRTSELLLQSAIMRTLWTCVLALNIAVSFLSCKKKEPEPPKPKTQTSASTSGNSVNTPAQPSPDDTVTAALRSLAGSDAKDCGTVSGQSGDLEAASGCAMHSNRANSPFFVRYDLPVPGTKMAIATARASDGKLYTVQYSDATYKQAVAGSTLSRDKKMLTMPCTAELRVASSGRVTCFPPQQNAGNIAASPHGGGMAMPSGANPHGSSPHGTMPAAGTNPHGSTPPPGSLDKSH